MVTKLKNPTDTSLYSFLYILYSFLMKQYNLEIDQAMEDSKNGRMIKATDLKAKIQKWS